MDNCREANHETAAAAEAGVAAQFDTSWLLGFAAGNFLLIGASDLVPEVNRHRDLGMGALHFLAFTAGAGLLAALKVVMYP
jgi:zinc and cadmium transporter